MKLREIKKPDPDQEGSTGRACQGRARRGVREGTRGVPGAADPFCHARAERMPNAAFILRSV